MSLINVTNLTFAYEGSYDDIFKDVSFQIDTDWKLGFTGRNGRGKTTFLNLLLGKYKYSGSITASVGFEYFPYEVCDMQSDTIDIIDGIHSDYLHWQLVKELTLLEVGEDVLYRPFATLSKGEQTKVLLAVLFLKENRFLLIDEPTNHLDQDARRIVGDYLQGKRGFILVSHDRAFLDRCTDHILSINKASIEIQKGNFSSWWKNKQMQDNFELAQNERLKKDISRLADAAKQASDWSGKVEKTKYGTKNSGLKPDKGYIGHKAAKMMKRSKSIQARQQIAADDKSKLLKNIETSERLKIAPLAFHGTRLIQLSNVSVRYGENIVCNDIGFEVNCGDRIALCGKNGSGKSSILRLICNGDVAYTGEYFKSSGLVISYVAQMADHLAGNLTEYAENRGIDESLFKAILRKLDFSRVQFEKELSDFSAGQKKKVLIAASLCERAHLYLWDEPLNYIDVLSRMQIEELLLQYKPTIVFVEHDSAFCRRVATKYVELSQ